MESQKLSSTNLKSNSQLVSFNNKMLALQVERESLKSQLEAAKGSSWDIQPLISAASQTVLKLNQLLSIFLRDFYYPLKWSRIHCEKERTEFLEHVQKWHNEFQQHVDYLLEFPHPPQVQEMLNALKTSLLYDSMVTNLQPPRVMMKQATQVDTSVRILHDNEKEEQDGKQNPNGQSSQFKIFMLKEEETVKLFITWKAGNSNLITPSVLLNLEETRNIWSSRRRAARQNLEPESNSLNTVFDGLKVNSPEMNSMEMDHTQKVCLLYLKIMIVNGIAMETWCVSLPFVVMSNSNQTCAAYATIFWENYFKKEENWLPFQVEEETSWKELSFALIDYFKSETKTEWNLTPENLKYIGKKIFNTDRFHDNSTVNRKEFCNAEEKPLSNWRWLFYIVELIKKHLAPFWNSGAIVGFIDRVEAENLIRSQDRGTFLIRFSDSLAGGISYTSAIGPTPNDLKNGFKSGAQSVQPLSYSNDGSKGDLHLLSLDKRILMNPMFTNVLYFERTLNYKEVLEPKEVKFTLSSLQDEENENPKSRGVKTSYAPPIVPGHENLNSSQVQTQTDVKAAGAENDGREVKNDNSFVTSSANETANAEASGNSDIQNADPFQNQNQNVTEWKPQEFLFNNVELIDLCTKLESELKEYLP